MTYYTVLSLHKDDLKEAVNFNKKMVKEIDNYSDDDMCEIAEKLGDLLMTNGWDDIIKLILGK